MDRDKQSARCFWAFATRTCNGMKMSYCASCTPSYCPLSRSESADGSYLQYHVFFACFVFPHRTGVSPPWPGSSIMTIGRSRPALPVVDHFVLAAPAFRGRLCCNLQQRQQRVLHILCIGRIEVHTRRSLNPATGARANSCGFTFALIQKPYVRFAGQIARRAPLDERVVSADLRSHPLEHRVQFTSSISTTTRSGLLNANCLFSADDLILPSRGCSWTQARRHRHDLADRSQADLTYAQ